MLLPQRSNWQEVVHDKFEEFAQGLGQNGEDGESEVEPQQTRFRLAPGGRARTAPTKLSNEIIAQFFVQLCRAAKPDARWTEIRLFRKCSLTLRNVAATMTQAVLQNMNARSPSGLAATRA
jgi:hypothetical protein